MWSYVTSYLTAAPAEEPPKKEEKQLNSYTEKFQVETKSGTDSLN